MECVARNWRPTVTQKWNPCRNSEVFSAAARSRQNATDRTERGSEHPSTQNPPALGCKIKERCKALPFIYKLGGEKAHPEVKWLEIQLPMGNKYGSVEWQCSSQQSSPGWARLFLTHRHLCLRCKIGKSIRVYSANTRNKYGVYRVYGVFGICCTLQAGFLQCNYYFGSFRQFCPKELPWAQAKFDYEYIVLS